MSRFVCLVALSAIVLSASLFLRAQTTPQPKLPIDPFGDPAQAPGADPFAPAPAGNPQTDPFAAPAVPVDPVPARAAPEAKAEKLQVDKKWPAEVAAASQGMIVFADESLGKEVLKKMTPAERMQYHLNRPARINLYAASSNLTELVEALSQKLQVNTELDTKALDQAAFDTATPFKCNMTHPGNLGAALRRVLNTESLDFVRLKDTLLITTRSAYEEKLFLKTYNLDREMFRPRTAAKYELEGDSEIRFCGLGAGFGGGGPSGLSTPPRDDDDPLIDIVQLIEPESWKANGGRGELHLDLKKSLLVVSQRQDVHDEIEILLTDLRKVARSNQQAIQANAQLERRVVFRLKLPEKVAGPPVPCGNGLGGEITPLEPAFTMKEVAELIKQQVEPHTWKDEKHTITILGECLIINQSEAVQTKIYQFLRELGITREQYHENNRPFMGFS